MPNGVSCPDGFHDGFHVGCHGDSDEVEAQICIHGLAPGAESSICFCHGISQGHSVCQNCIQVETACQLRCISCGCIEVQKLIQSLSGDDGWPQSDGAACCGWNWGRNCAQNSSIGVRFGSGGFGIQTAIQSKTVGKLGSGSGGVWFSSAIHGMDGQPEVCPG